MYSMSVLANGLSVLTVPMPHVQSVTTAYFLGAGSRYEHDHEAGVSHFLEHLCFKGTQRRPAAQQISETIERVGGYMNAGTDREMTIYWAKVAKPYFETALDLLSDMIGHSIYEPEEMERERKVIIEELAAVNDSPGQKVDVLTDAALWPGEPLGRDIGGSRDSVTEITREMILDYVSDQYAPNNMVLAVAGDLDHESVVAAAEKQVGDWPSTTPRSWIPSLQGERDPVVALETRRTEQAHFCLALRGLSSQHPDRYALGLLNAILGEGMSSRLFLELRERQGLAYDVHSSVSHFMDDGAIVVYAGVDPTRIDNAITLAMGELDRIREGVSSDELEKAQAMTKGRLLLRTEDTRSMAGWVGGQELLHHEIKTLDEIVSEIDDVTPSDVKRVANEVIVMDRLNLAVVGPFRSRARFERVLRRGV